MCDVTKVIFVCDESGAKGYSDMGEKTDGETGVFAGFLLDAESLPQILPDFQEIYDRYEPTTGKFHIADLPPEQKEALRREVFDAILKHQLPCFWYAIHVEGFFRYYEATNAHLEASQRDHQAHGEPRVRRGSPRRTQNSLHVELFSGLYANLIAFLEERKRKHVEIEIRSDQVDDPIVAEFERVMRSLLDQSAHVSRKSGFDTETKKVVHGTITFTVEYPPEMHLDIVVDKVSVNRSNSGDPLVLAADVIANSLNHHFDKRAEPVRYGPLNRPAAVSGHPLEQCLNPFDDWGEDADLVGDRLFQHPKSRTPHGDV